MATKQFIGLWILSFHINQIIEWNDHHHHHRIVPISISSSVCVCRQVWACSFDRFALFPFSFSFDRFGLLALTPHTWTWSHTHTHTHKLRRDTNTHSAFEVRAYIGSSRTYGTKTATFLTHGLKKENERNRRTNGKRHQMWENGFNWITLTHTHTHIDIQWDRDRKLCEYTKYMFAIKWNDIEPRSNMYNPYTKIRKNLIRFDQMVKSLSLDGSCLSRSCCCIRPTNQSALLDVHWRRPYYYYYYYYCR